MNRRWAIALLVLACLLVYGRSLGYGSLSWDDDKHIFNNQHVLQAQFLFFWKQPFFNLYIPLTYNAWQIIALASGADPRAFHAASLLAHVINVSMVFFLVRKLSRAADDAVALLAAALFAIHPLQVASVVWISGLKDLLFACLGLISISFYLRFLESRSRLWYAGAAAAFALSLLAKPAAVVVPLILAVIQTAVYGESWKKSALALGPWLALAAPVMVVTKLAQPDALLDRVPPIAQRPLIAADAIAFYLYKLALPIELLPDYGRTPRSIFASGAAWLTWLMPAGIAFALWRARRRSNLLVAGALIFAAALLPVLGFVPFAFQAHSTVSDNYLYLPLFGAALSLAAFLSRHGRWRKAAAAVLLLFAARAWAQVEAWKDDTSFFGRAAEGNVASESSISNLALAMQRKGQREEALRLYRQALAIRSDNPVTWNNIGNLLLEMGDLDGVIGHFEPYLRRNEPQEATRRIFSRMHANLAAAFIRKGNLDRGRAECEEALRLDAENASAFNSLGAISYLAGRYADAIGYYRRALALEPQNASFADNLRQAQEASR